MTTALAAVQGNTVQLSPVVASGTSTTTPTPPKSVDPNSVTPGLAGFLVVFVLAIATWLLMRNMTGHLRRMRFREQERIAKEGPDSPPDDQPHRH